VRGAQIKNEQQTSFAIILQFVNTNSAILYRCEKSQ